MMPTDDAPGTPSEAEQAQAAKFDAYLTLLANSSAQAGAVLEAAAGHRAKALQCGFETHVAETMACQFYSTIMAGTFGR